MTKIYGTQIKPTLKTRNIQK